MNKRRTVNTFELPKGCQLILSMNPFLKRDSFISAIAKKNKMDFGYTHAVIKAAQRKKLVVTTRSGRQVLVSLTEKGLRVQRLLSELDYELGGSDVGLD